MIVQAKMVTSRIYLVIAMAVCYGVDVCFGYHSCKDLRINNPGIPSGEYTMWNGNGQTYEAYCEFRGNTNHGNMFISRNAASIPINMAKIDPSASDVLVRHRRSNGKQFDTIMTQLSSKAYLPLSIQYNRNTDYASPLNHATLAPYLYLGFLPSYIAIQKSIQGYRANAQDFTFKNCDANPNSYIAFFFNTQNKGPTNYHTKCCYTNLMRDWINLGYTASATLPDYYFFQFEMHMGGCGGYAINKYSTLNDIEGAALGMRFCKLSKLFI